ncbi:hypothetical protein [Leptothoe spongobia]|uniref:Uncharacterized protein n=1 Tax=Leptothoe spongobia TAU-MAC 1115 TaxID=1967444 RepID=A0A947GRN4_9CYAN|nr:hypothetical protein [Leptothoe spongobia]MBT9317561.1 hypothetical protein [Leptothoe spongobia TAU-MAC 1115]
MAIVDLGHLLMRLPPSVRYLPSRLQFASNPWLWLGILMTGIVGLYAWEYRQNPGQLPWQINAQGLGNNSSNSNSTDRLLESLTPEEQSIAAELDNVELLLAQLDSDVSALTTGGDSSAAAALNAAIDASEVSESNVDRLKRYIGEYSFLGTGARGANVQSNDPQTIAPVQRPTESILNLRSESESGQAASALGASFAQRQLELPASSPTSPARTGLTGGTSNSDVDSREGTTSEAAAVDNATDNQAIGQTTFSFDQFGQTGVAPGSLEGLNRPFIRTTPNMSPPPGTTGYVPPASLSDFNRLTQQRSGADPFSTQPATGSLGTTAPSAGRANTQVLPPADIETAAPLQTPAFDSSSQINQSQPRNAWENFWD